MSVLVVQRLGADFSGLEYQGHGDGTCVPTVCESSRRGSGQFERACRPLSSNRRDLQAHRGPLRPSETPLPMFRQAIAADAGGHVDALRWCPRGPRSRIPIRQNALDVPYSLTDEDADCAMMVSPETRPHRCGLTQQQPRRRSRVQEDSQRSYRGGVVPAAGIDAPRAFPQRDARPFAPALRLTGPPRYCRVFRHVA